MKNSHWIACLGLALILVGLAVGQSAAPPTANDLAPAPGSPGRPGNEGSVVVETPKMSMLDLLSRGGVLMWPLAGCSLLGVALIAERLLALRKKPIVPPDFADGLITALGSERDIGAAREYCRVRDCPMARVILAGLRKLDKGEEAAEAAIEDAGANEVAKLRTNFRLLNGIAVVSPMIGLLGTVQGMIQAFQIASQRGLGQGEKLAEGIYIALVTTFAGLCIAIPVLLCYVYFQSRIDMIVSLMNDVSVRVLEHVFAEHRVDHPIKSRNGLGTHAHHHPATPPSKP